MSISDYGLTSMVIAPATASTIGKMANGIADNMLITTYLSAKEKVMVAPAMDLDMWAHPSTQRNISILKADGVDIIEPASGELASHLTGKGRMEEPENIVAAIERYFASGESMRGKKVVVTAGPTYEKIDPVRFIGNYSSGKMGFAVADEFAARGAEVTLVAGPVGIVAENPAVKRVDVESAQEMLEAVKKAFDDCDVCVLSAAVADYRPEFRADSKIKREGKEELNINLVRNPDIAATLGAMKGSRILVGFALETDHELENAKGKLERKNLDLIVLNSLKEKGAGFMTDTNKVTIIDRDLHETVYLLKSKREVASDIANEVERLIGSGKSI